MKPIMQTQFSPNGNCLSAVVASLLDMPIEDVPNFTDSIDTFWQDFEKFIQSKGYQYLGTKRIDERCKTIDGFYIVLGTSPRGISHSVIYKNGELVHDPHPQGGGVKPMMILEIAKKE